MRYRTSIDGLQLALISLLSIVLYQGLARGGDSTEVAMDLPKTVCGFSQCETPRKILAKGLFDYMDGAGELYLGYRFKHLDVYEYARPGEEKILVELYWMETSDDAFGLLSGDWDGEPVDIGQAGNTSQKDSISTSQSPSPPAPLPKGEGSISGNSPSSPAAFPKGEGVRQWPGNRALYGSGLLRIWSDDLYVRIMAFQETARSKEAVMALGRMIVSGRKNHAPPRLLEILPLACGKEYNLRPDRTCYFRSHLVLNSVYFLSTGNILELGRAAEAITAAYSPADKKDRPARLILIRYGDAKSAKVAIKHFEKIYLPERPPALVESDSGKRHFCRIEDGFLGYTTHGRFAALVFECPSRESAARFIEETTKGLDKLEVGHE
jgi:hypothetical protein